MHVILWVGLWVRPASKNKVCNQRCAYNVKLPFTSGGPHVLHKLQNVLLWYTRLDAK